MGRGPAQLHRAGLPPQGHVVGTQGHVAARDTSAPSSLPCSLGGACGGLGVIVTQAGQLATRAPAPDAETHPQTVPFFTLLGLWSHRVPEVSSARGN